LGRARTAVYDVQRLLYAAAMAEIQPEGCHGGCGTPLRVALDSLWHWSLGATRCHQGTATEAKWAAFLHVYDISWMTSCLGMPFFHVSVEVSDMEVALKQAGENRKADNQLYQQSISDQRATIAVLNMAAARLKKFYTPGALVQIHAHAAPPPKPSANAYEKGENAGGVMQMLATIVSDAQGVEAELEINEQNEQKNYAEFVASTTASIQADRDATVQKQEQSAQASGEKSETEEAQLANDGSLAELNQLLTATHTDCDWILKYFDIRQQSRKDEMNAIEEAKAILSGANFA